MSYTSTEYSVLTRGGCGAQAGGRTEWAEVNGSTRAEWPVTTNAFGGEDIFVKLKIPLKLPWGPTILLIFRNHYACRLDVNQKHRENGVLYDATHWQWSEHWPGPERFKVATGAPVLPTSGAVGGADYHAVLRFFLDSLSIVQSQLDWVDPPGGVQ